MTQSGLYRLLHLPVAVALFLSMAMPLVTFACDLTGMIETPMTMSSHGSMSGDAHADCPCSGPMKDMCVDRAADCAEVVNCHGGEFDRDACCSSQPALDNGVVSASLQVLQLDAVLAGVSSDLSVPMRTDARVPVPAPEQAPPRAGPIHILHASLLL